MILLLGALAQPEFADALGLQGEVRVIHGKLEGGGGAGWRPGEWPALSRSDGTIAARAVEWTPELRRYSEIMGARPVDFDGQQVLGVADGVALPGTAEASPDEIAALAAYLAGLDPTVSPDTMRTRMPLIHAWIGSRVRAMREASQKIGPDGSDRVAVEEWAEPYSRFFTVEEARLRHRLFNGGWSDPLQRAVFVSGDAAVLLPWDPVTDLVLVVTQFRAGPQIRGDAEPWLIETVAGRIDPHETPEAAAIREAEEEAGITIKRIVVGPHNYPSPGATAEYLYLFVGIADLPKAGMGHGGVETEGEDIRTEIIPRARLSAMVQDGVVRNGPLIVLSLWLDAHAEALARA